MYQLRFTLLTVAVLLLSACATLKPKYVDPADTAEKSSMPDADHRVYLIGNTGELTKDGQLSPALRMLQQQLAAESEDATVIFLGDLVYQGGMPEKEDKKRDEAERIIDLQLSVVEDFPGEIYFLPGDRDWQYDAAGIRRLEKYIEKKLDRGDVFVPDDACSGPEIEDINDNTVVLLIDSQWYLNEWDNVSDINRGCDERTRARFEREFEDELKDLRYKNVIVAMHHPVKSYGARGGYYSGKNHLFPFTMAGAKVPLPAPVVGSIAAFFRGVIPGPQDLRHPRYDDLAGHLVNVGKKYGANVIFAGAHDNSLQYMVEKGQHVVVSGGGGVRHQGVKMGDELTFGAGLSGFAVLDIMEDGSTWLRFESADKKTPGTIYHKQIKERLTTPEDKMPENFTIYEQQLDSIDATILNADTFKLFSSKMWGTLYTDYYFDSIRVPVIDLGERGWKAVERGGGFQTYSLRLEDPDGRLYQMRSLKKRADAIPYPFDRTFVKDVLEQLYTAANPYGAYIVEPLAEAAGILHTKPQLVYIPKQPALGRWNDDYGDELYLLEARPDENWETADNFANSKDIVSTFAVIEELTDNNKAYVDRELFLRSRLFDWVIGDWDRHQDQWRWAETEGTDDRKLFLPIPQDRDQAFAKYNGWVTNTARKTLPILRMMRTYDEEIEDNEIQWQNFNGYDVDNYFLNELDWEVWEKEVRELQSRLTDEVIEDAFRWLPRSVYERMAPELMGYAKSRRDNLMDTARKYYQIMNEDAIVVATNKENLFEIERSDATTKVTIWEYRDDRKEKDLLFERAFDNSITKQIRLYGLDDDDVFRLTGQSKDGPLVRMIGGLGMDEFDDESKVNGIGKKNKVHDNLAESLIRKSGETADRRSRRTEVNSYEFMDRGYDYQFPLPFVGFNPDDGVFIGAMLYQEKFKFRKTNIHTFTGKFAFATTAFGLYYSGDYRNAVDKWDFTIDAAFEGPQFARNYFGIGNDTDQRIDETGRDFYRLRRGRYMLSPGLKNRFANGAFVAFNATGERISIDETEGRFLATLDDIPERALQPQYFGKLGTTFSYNNVDDTFIPTRGIDFETNLGWTANLEDLDRNFATVSSSLAIYLRLGTTDKVVLASRIGGATNIGDDYEFYQAVTVGGHDNLRGFSFDRFAGQTSFYHQTDLRIKLLGRDSYFLPIAIGFAPGIDYGRVWADEQTSDTWHVGYGGLLWFAPYDLVAIGAGYYLNATDDDNRFIVRAGFQF